MSRILHELANVGALAFGGFAAYLVVAFVERTKRAREHRRAQMLSRVVDLEAERQRRRLG